MKNEEIILEFNNLDESNPELADSIKLSLNQSLFSFRQAYGQGNNEICSLSNLQIPGPDDVFVDIFSDTELDINLKIFIKNDDAKTKQGSEFLLKASDGDIYVSEDERMIEVEKSSQDYVNISSEINSILAFAVYKSLSN